MSEAIARPETAKNGTSKVAPTRRPTPPIRRADPALPEPIDAFDFLDRIGEIGVHWWSLIDHVLELQSSKTGKEQPVPEWALNILNDQGRHSSSNEDFRVQRDNLREILRLEQGKSTYCFEVWGDRTTRLSLRHDSVADAMPERDYWRANGHPAAFIMKLHRRDNTSTAEGVAMLDTLVGAVRFAGVTLAQGDDDEHVFQMMDETGRTVSLTASQLRGHPVIHRVHDKRNLESLQAWLQEKTAKGGQL